MYFVLCFTDILFRFLELRLEFFCSENTPVFFLALQKVHFDLFVKYEKSNGAVLKKKSTIFFKRNDSYILLGYLKITLLLLNDKPYINYMYILPKMQWGRCAMHFCNFKVNYSNVLFTFYIFIIDSLSLNQVKDGVHNGIIRYIETIFPQFQVYSLHRRSLQYIYLLRDFFLHLTFCCGIK